MHREATQQNMLLRTVLPQMSVFIYLHREKKNEVPESIAGLLQ